MSQNLITNQDKFLSEVINNILPGCDKAYFLVGYFYFSGFQEIYEQLRDKHLRILVGLDIERSLANGIREIDDYSQKTKTRVQTRDEYYQGLVDIFNNTDFFDTERQIEAFKLFCDKFRMVPWKSAKHKTPTTQSYISLSINPRISRLLSSRVK